MRYNFKYKNVLITGASSGIGYQMATLLAAKGANLILVARREDRLKKLAEDLRGVQDFYGTTTTVIPMDLVQDGACEALFEKLLKVRVDVLVNAAGFGQLKASVDIPLKKEMEMLRLNCEVLHRLTRLFLKQMMQRKEGLILNVASSAGLLPAGPYLASYYATKAYVASYSRGLDRELRDRKCGVRVMSLCPGPVNTEFTAVAGGTEWEKGMSAKKCAQIAVNGMESCRRQTIIPGGAVRFGIFAVRFLPKCLVAWILGIYQRRKVL